MKDAKYNVILMTPSPNLVSGGIAGWAKRFISIADSYGIDAKIVDESARNDSRGTSDHYRHNYFYEAKRSVSIWKDLKKQLKTYAKGEPVVVHCCIPSLPTSLFREIRSISIAHRYGAKFIFHFRSTVTTSATSRIARSLLKKALKKADGIILLNKSSLDYCQSIYPNEKSVIIPNFIKDEEFVEKTSFNPSLKKVLYVGRVYYKKGTDEIIEAAKRTPSIEYYLVGKISESYSAFRKEDCPNVNFEGEKTKEEIRLYMYECDVFMFLTKQNTEGFSNALTEAMAHGLPCIATNWAANPDQIGEYANELVVPVGNIDAVIKALNFLGPSETRKNVSLYNYDRAKILYSETAVMPQYCSFYQKIID